MRVVLGNRNAVQTVKKADPENPEGDLVDSVETMTRGKRATEIEIPDETPLIAALTSITHPQGVWANHATDGAKPAWVASDNEMVAQALAEHWGGIEVRELDVNPPRKASRGAGGAAATAGTALLLGVLLWTIALLQPLLRTSAGADFQAKQMAGSASATAVAKWVGVTANTTTPVVGDTSLTGEITTAGGGLVRAAGVYAHTTGASSYTITITFTANGSDSLPVTLGKAGFFDAASGGTLVFSTLITPTATLSASGDNTTLTDTVTL